MNLIELVEQARAVVRVWDGDRLVVVVPVRYPLADNGGTLYTGVTGGSNIGNVKHSGRR